MGIYLQVPQHMGPFLCVLDQLFHRSYFICDALSNSISAATSGSEKTEGSLKYKSSLFHESSPLLYVVL